ncbi:ANTAR domain-containing response regulator [Cupriavidus sp. D39]|uniref:ANTAR domain-containing response regulator n=1 Tax=Cupriavidus sp. D39 TaxID=2997877 RepID=UPI002271F4F0|nr:ANTAR domain-containing protein [Cupriavidus sp. D39]MCY0857187.1 ANTAR domain-containing protein [Cupriavidus sp. D39]
MDGGSQRRTIRATPPLLKDLRTLRVLVFHPDDTDGKQLTQQLQRIGCQVQAFWPPLPTLPEGVDVIFLAVRPDSIDVGFEWLKTEEVPTIIAVVTYENPTIVETVLHIGSQAVLPSPVRSFGLLSALVVARQVHGKMKAHVRKVRKLEGKLLGVRRIAEAKSILMRTRQISDGAAYDLIRDQAMSKRVTTEEIAAAIINANEILSLGKL